MNQVPRPTVAAVVEHRGRFLLVEEETEAGIAFNQPAGHLEADESPAEGMVRETLEETACRVEPEALLGIYRWRSPSNDTTYLRFAFTARYLGEEPGRALDEGIIRAVWLTLEEVRLLRPRHRTPLVLRCIEDYLAGRRFPLELISQVP
jgi:ADP-ribose pyrophosphatase YjhB (NUDIX family)